MKLPHKLNRKAVKLLYDKLDEATWEYLFDHEKDNGIHECRVPSDGRKAYYSREQLKVWLIQEGHYTFAQLNQPERMDWHGLTGLTVHRIAG